VFYTAHTLQLYNSWVGPRLHMEVLLAADSFPVTGIKPPSPYFLIYPAHPRESRKHPVTDMAVPPHLTLMTIN